MKKQLNLIYLLPITIILFSTCKKNKPVTLTIMGEVTVSNITSITAVLTGTTLEIGENMEVYGHVWGETSAPEIASNPKSEHTDSKPGTFVDEMKNLNPETKYYVRPYAKDGDEIIYKEVVSFTTFPELQVPTVVTVGVTEIGCQTTTCGGNVVDEGESSVTIKGVCWSIYENPTTADDNSQDGEGSGTFISYITGLEDNTTYYVRAYMTNSEGTFYGQQVSFTTLGLFATVTTNDILGISFTTSIGGGNVTDEGCHPVTSRGVCWSTSENPTTSGNAIENGTGGGTFVCNITELSHNTLYYIRAYAVNEIGTAYGNQIQFTTLGFNGTVTDIDGYTYNTIIIGAQEWMAEDLRVTHYPNSDAIPEVTENTAWANLAADNTSDAYCFYKNDNSTDYGALYTYAAAIGDNWARDNVANQGVCPDGWHLPTDAEWTELSDYLGGTSVAGGKLKETGTTHWSSPNTGATNESGFSALPGGFRDWEDGGFYYDARSHGAWWCATAESPGVAWHRVLYYALAEVHRGIHYGSCGYSVRCVKD